MEAAIKPPVFLNADIQHSFEESGFVKLPLLEDQEVQHLVKFADEVLHQPRPVIGFAEKLSYYISIFDNNADHKLTVNNLIGQLVQSKLSNILVDYETFYSNFMIKYPNNGFLECHQDFNLVDESIYTAFNLWCPLIDTHEQNGGLSFIPGSHKITNLYRGPNMPFSFTTYNDQLIKKGIPLPVKAGECVIFDHKTIHFSTPNQSNQIRYAVQSVLKPMGAESLLYLYDSHREQAIAKKITTQFTIESGFWSEKTAELPTLHTRPYANPQLQDDVQALIRG